MKSRCVFKRANRGGAHSYNSATFFQSRIDLCRSVARNQVTLTVHLVVFHFADANRLKGSETDVQGDLGDFDAAFPDPLQNFLREVQSGGWRGDGAGLARKNGLI